MKFLHNLARIPRENLEYPAIDSAPLEPGRPFWSVMIPTYNRASYVERTLKSILLQDPGPEEMQIEVVDDCSPGSEIEAVVNKLGKDRIAFHRQPQNVGLSSNWTTCINRARGRYVHIMHDDDMVMPNFYAEYRAFLEKHSQTVLLFSRAMAIDSNDAWVYLMWAPPDWDPAQPAGILKDPLYQLAKRDFIVCPTAVVARSAYEQVGGFARNQFYAVDWEMWLRLARNGPFGYINQPLYYYRVHGDAETNKLAETGQNIKEVAATAAHAVSLLPPHLRRQAKKETFRNAAEDAINFRRQLHEKQKYAAGLYYAWWAFKLQPNARHFFYIAKSAARATIAKLKTRPAVVS